jgi:Spy/CpxP family protein refolding chaperone
MAAELRIHVMSGIVVLGTFLAGAMAGAGIERMQQRRELPGPPFFHGRAVGTGEDVHFMALPGLSLSPDQQKKIERIVTGYRPQFEAVVRESFPRVRAVQEKMNAEIRAVLTPEQQKQFDEAQRAPPGFGFGLQGPSLNVTTGPGMPGPSMMPGTVTFPVPHEMRPLPPQDGGN